VLNHLFATNYFEDNSCYVYVPEVGSIPLALTVALPVQKYPYFNSVHADVHPSLTPLTVSSNGTYNVQNTHGEEYEGYSSVNVDVPIPEGYIKPTETMTITENGQYGVANCVNVTVNVPIPEGYIKPEGEATYDENGVYDVTTLKTVIVNTPVNTTKPTVTNLKYKEKILHSIKLGDILTLHCDNKRMESDIEIAVVEDTQSE
jgi:hypothetical protein